MAIINPKYHYCYQELYAGAKPEIQYSLPEWAQKFRMLSSKASPEPGLWRNERTPFAVGIMDELSNNSGTEIVILMKGAQIAGTELGNNWIGYIIDNYPANILYVMPTLSTLKRNVKIRLNPLLEDTPRLKEKVAKARARDGSNTIFNKEFNGGALIMSGANSAVGLKSLPARYVFLDEVEEFPDDLDGQGDPIALAMARTKTFGRKRKIYIPSTPATRQSSKIEPLFLMGDQRHYHVPCPKCKKSQPLLFTKDTLVYENNDPATAMYVCEFCKHRFNNAAKELILKHGIWIPKTKSKKRNMASFFLPSIYSPVGWYSWEDMVEEWIGAQGKPLKLKTFANTVLAETWEERGEAPDWEKIYRRKSIDYQKGTPPNVPMIITAGVDIQADRIELEKVGFCNKGITYSCDYKVLIGDTGDGAVWEKLIEELKKPVVDQAGNKRQLIMAACDTGHHTTKVYALARDYPELIIPVKGDGKRMQIISRGKPIEVQAFGQTVKTTLALYLVGTNIIKSEIYALLRIGDHEKPGFQFFPSNYDEEYFQQLTAESLQRKRSPITGITSYIYIKNRDRNEALDCRVYARAAAEYVGYSNFKDDEWEKVGNIFHDDVNLSEQPKKKKNRVRSKGI